MYASGHNGGRITSDLTKLFVYLLPIRIIRIVVRANDCTELSPLNIDLIVAGWTIFVARLVGRWTRILLLIPHIPTFTV